MSQCERGLKKKGPQHETGVLNYSWSQIDIECWFAAAVYDRTCQYPLLTKENEIRIQILTNAKLKKKKNDQYRSKTQTLKRRISSRTKNQNLDLIVLLGMMFLLFNPKFSEIMRQRIFVFVKSL